MRDRINAFAGVMLYILKVDFQTCHSGDFSLRIFGTVTQRLYRIRLG